MDIKTIIHLPVYTESGYYLGEIIKVKVDPRTGMPLQYIVRSKNFIKNLFQENLIINQSQVVSLSREKMVVNDTLKRIKGFASSPAG